MEFLKKQILVPVLIGLGVGLSGCSRHNEDMPPRAKTATVQLRRDILGCSSSLPVSPTTDSINGAQVSISGKLLQVNKEWVVLEQGRQEYWIPRDNVLLIRIN